MVVRATLEVSEKEGFKIGALPRSNVNLRHLTVLLKALQVRLLAGSVLQQRKMHQKEMQQNSRESKMYLDMETLELRGFTVNKVLQTAALISATMKTHC